MFMLVVLLLTLTVYSFIKALLSFGPPDEPEQDRDDQTLMN
jgi:hypothetical protein